MAWQISFDHIRDQRQSAADLLSLMSFFDRQGIQKSVLRCPSATTHNARFEDGFLTLRDFLFITVIRDASAFEIHNLVQLATRKWLVNQGQLDKWKAHSVSNLYAEPLMGQSEHLEKCQALLPT
jgi:hypothetical protein